MFHIEINQMIGGQMHRRVGCLELHTSEEEVAKSLFYDLERRFGEDYSLALTYTRPVSTVTVCRSQNY